MKNKLLILASVIVVALSLGSCASDSYICRSPREYPPVYRTYQDENHGGMDAEHGGRNCNHYEQYY